MTALRLPAGLETRGPVQDRFDEILTADALANELAVTESSKRLVTSDRRGGQWDEHELLEWADVPIVNL